MVEVDAGHFLSLVINVPSGALDLLTGLKESIPSCHRRIIPAMRSNFLSGTRLDIIFQRPIYSLDSRPGSPAFRVFESVTTISTRCVGMRDVTGLSLFSGGPTPRDEPIEAEERDVEA